MLGNHLENIALIKRHIENWDSFTKLFSSTCDNLVSEALTRENNFWFSPPFFAIYQIIPLENEGHVTKACNNFVKNVNKLLF